MEYYISVILIAVSALLSTAVSLPIFKILQLSGYKAKGVFTWWKATGYNTLVRYIALCLFGLIATVVYIGCFSTFEYVRYIAVALYIVLCMVFIFSVKKSGNADIKFTARMIRLISCDVVLMLVLAAGVAFATYYQMFCQTLVTAFALFAPFVAMLANIVMTPLERLNNGKYVKRAKKKLKELSPVVIGITGSYGKTTAKNLLKCMLDGERSVLATPGSFNTPMGVCKTINGELNGQEVFIAELGARYRGDIKELCGIVAPKYGIITAIGDMHLATLKTREGVARVKYELAECLPDDGLLALNGYNPDCAALAGRGAAVKTEVTGDGSRVAYSDLAIDVNGTSFTLVIDGKGYKVTTRLLGAHVAELACVCAVIALECGVPPQKIADAVSAAEPVEHRLQLISNGAVTVIDDAYNSNPVGAANALDVLNCFTQKKVIITPGFVELGAIEKSSNMELGKKISEVCDYAYLIGTRADDIKKGALDAGMSESVISCFSSRDEAVKALESIAGERVVLFENDLPDNIK